MRINNKKNIILSVTALVMVLFIAAGVTFSWIEGGNKGYVNGGDIVISSGSNLTMRQDGKTTSSIIIPSCTLEEVSSADGRNYFFPMGDCTSNQTASMTFREGIPADENTRYVSVDFELEAGDSATEVYLGAGTIVQCENQQVMNALRMSFNLNDGSTPIVFKPNQMPGVNMTYSPITSISAVGKATTTTTSTDSYGDYYYSGDDSTPIFSLNKGETKKITLSLWLEGTAFTGDTVAGQSLNVYVDFTTTVDDLVKYNFVDNTHGYGDALYEGWIDKTDELAGTKYETMMYIYDVAAQRYYAMEKNDDGTEWTAYVPKSITNFYFRRYSIDIDQWWNEWEPNMGEDMVTDPDGEYTYIAICGNTEGTGTELDGCYGYWQDEDDTIRVYFQLQTNWNNTKCYAWRNDGSRATSSWPGNEMEYSHNNGDNKPVYYIDLTGASKLAGIQFNNSVNSQQFEIKDTQYFFNGFITWYESESKNGHWLYTEEEDSLIYPVNDPTP